jgi:hypothetical protein
MQVDGRPPLTPMNATQIQSRDPVPAFARSPHDVPSLLPGTTARLIHDMPAMFQTPVDQPNVLAGVVADVMASPSQTLRPAPAFMPDYQAQVDSYRISTGLDNDSAMNSSSIHPPLPDPQVAPSAIHQISPGFAVSTSSLATALDSMAANTSRSRACSTASPGKHLPAAVFPMNGGVVSPMESAGVVFPAADFSGGINDCRDAAQEVHNDQLMVDVGHALTRFVSNPCAIGTVHKFVFFPFSVAGYTAGLSETAHSASEAWFVGQNAEVNYMFDDLKKRWSIITEIITKIDMSLSLKDTPPPLHHASPTIPAAAPTLIGMIPSPSIESRPMDMQSNMDTSDGSRKRCASAMASGQGDRVIKAPKMEPMDDVIPLTTSPSKTIPLSPPHLFAPGAVSASSVVNRSLPPSAPPSRASTPPVTSMNVTLLQQSPHVVSPSVPIEFAMPSQSVPPFPTGVRNRSSWSEATATLPPRHHQHSLSGTSLNTTVNVHGLGMISSTSTQPFTAPGTYGTPSTQRSIPNGGNAISPPLGRITRSGSITAPAVNTISFGFSDLSSVDQRVPPRASTSGLTPHRVTPDSDEGDETEDDILDTKTGNYNHVSSSLCLDMFYSAP